MEFRPFTNAIQMFEAGRQNALARQDRVREQQRRNALMEIGTMAGAGDFKGAASKALGLGDFQTANSLMEMGKPPPTPEGFTLGEGQVRFDAFGKQIAAGPPRRDTGGDVKHGLNLQYWMTPDNQLHAGQLTEGGGIAEVPLPEGGNWAPGVGYLDTGTGYIPYDRKAGIAGGTELIPKDIEGAEAAKEVGQQKGKQIAAAPGDVDAAALALDLVDQLRVDPNRKWGTGGTSIFNFIPSTPGYDYQNKVNQATSGAFLTAVQQMRGLGQLSNVEGQTAKSAVTRMDTATSEEAFLAALADYENVIRAARDRAAARIKSYEGGGAPGKADLSSPGGDIIDGYTIEQVE